MASAQEITITAVGDTRLGKHLNLLRQPERAKVMREWVGASDVAIANLEMALTRRGARADKLAVLRSDPQVVNEVAACGFSVVTLANNHVMDYGPIGLEDTLSAVDAAGLHRVGAGLDWDEATRPLQLELSEGRLLHIVNFACTLGPGAAAAPGRAGVAPLRVTQQYQVDPIFIQEQPGTAPWVETFVRPQDERAACEAVARAREQGGWVLAIIHWGIPPHWQAPFQGWLATYQRPLARRLVDAGAHAIIGHHPEVLHGIEIMDGCPVFYSIGHFAFHPRELAPAEPLMSEPGYRLHWQEALSVSAADSRKREAVVLRLQWQGRSWQARLTPVWLDDSGEPEPAKPARAERILSRLQTMSGQLGCALTVREGEARLAWEA